MTLFLSLNDHSETISMILCQRYLLLSIIFIIIIIIIIIVIIIIIINPLFPTITMFN